MVRRSLLMASLALLATSCTTATELRTAGRVFRDCSDCPELVTVIPEAGALSGVSAIAVGRFEVTRKEFALFEKDEQLPSPICTFAFIEKDLDQDLPDRRNPGFGEDADDQPAICVSRIEAQAYVEWLSSKTGQRYRLPSELESRYFQRANAATRFPWGNGSADACSFANVLDQTAASQAWATNPRPELLDYLPTKRGVLDCDDGAAYVAPVGSYKPNALGLYDTTGNVWEWTADCIANEKQWPEGSFYPPCFARGGGWHSSPADLSDQGRLEQLANVHAPDVGFRVVRLISNEVPSHVATSETLANFDGD